MANLSIPFRIPEELVTEITQILADFQFLSGFQLIKTFDIEVSKADFQFLSGFQNGLWVNTREAKQVYFQFLSGFQEGKIVGDHEITKTGFQFLSGFQFRTFIPTFGSTILSLSIPFRIPDNYRRIEVDGIILYFFQFLSGFQRHLSS